MKSAVFLTLISGALALPAPPSAPGSAPLQKVSLGQRSSMLTRANGEANVAGILASLNQTLHKYQAKTLPYYAPVAQMQAEMFASPLIKRQVNEKLTDQYEGTSEDVAYYGTVTIGAAADKPQDFNLLFDTGSSDIWVPGPDCKILEGCVHTTKYDQGGKSLGNTTSIEYGSGSTEGKNYVDEVTIAGLTSEKQTLISVTTATGFTTLTADGLCGMAFTSIAQDKGTTFFENLMGQGSVTADEFGFYLGRIADGTEGGSELTLGGRDESKYTGDFVTVPVSSQTYWQVAVDSVKVKGKSAGDSTVGQAAIDTGTTIVLAPTTAAKDIMKLIPGTFGFMLEGEELYMFPCDTETSLIPTITLAGEDFAINPLDFNLGSVSEDDVINLALGDTTLATNIKDQMADAGYCIAAFAGANLTDIENLYIVGETFIKNWYSVFSYTASDGEPAVLFAPNIGQS